MCQWKLKNALGRFLPAKNRCRGFSPERMQATNLAGGHMFHGFAAFSDARCCIRSALRGSRNLKRRFNSDVLNVPSRSKRCEVACSSRIYPVQHD